MAGGTADQGGSGSSPAGANFIAGLIVIGVLVGLIFLVRGLVPADLPPDHSSNFIDSIFHNKGVVLAARLLLVSAAVVLAMGGVFIIVSMVIRMKNREWLKRAGPFEIGQAGLVDIEAQIDKWRTVAQAGQEEVAELTGRIKDSDELIGELQDEIDKPQLDIDDG